MLKSSGLVSRGVGEGWPTLETNKIVLSGPKWVLVTPNVTEIGMNFSLFKNHKGSGASLLKIVCFDQRLNGNRWVLRQQPRPRGTTSNYA